MQSYEELLERARSGLPEAARAGARFQIPKALSHIQGNRTIISNFHQLADALGRQPGQLLKWLLRELASPGELKSSGAAILGTQIQEAVINEKLAAYVSRYVLCSACGRPDTSLEAEAGLEWLRCSACGARRAVR